MAADGIATYTAHKKYTLGCRRYNLAVWLFQQVAVGKPWYLNELNEYSYGGYVRYC